MSNSQNAWYWLLRSFTFNTCKVLKRWSLRVDLRKDKTSHRSKSPVIMLVILTLCLFGMDTANAFQNESTLSMGHPKDTLFVCTGSSLSDMLHRSVFRRLSCFSAACRAGVQRQVSAVEPGCMLQVVHTEANRASCVCLRSWHHSCHYPVTALIKWLARRREAFMKMPGTESSTCPYTQKAFTFMSDTFSPSDVDLLAVDALSSRITILAPVLLARSLSSLCCCVRRHTISVVWY